jgi:hypothetical protein
MRRRRSGQLAGRRDQPSEHHRLEHRIGLARGVESETAVGQSTIRLTAAGTESTRSAASHQQADPKLRVSWPPFTRCRATAFNTSTSSGACAPTRCARSSARAHWSARSEPRSPGWPSSRSGCFLSQRKIKKPGKLLRFKFLGKMAQYVRPSSQAQSLATLKLVTRLPTATVRGTRRPPNNDIAPNSTSVSSQVSTVELIFNSRRRIHRVAAVDRPAPRILRIARHPVIQQAGHQLACYESRALHVLRQIH